MANHIIDVDSRRCVGRRSLARDRRARVGRQDARRFESHRLCSCITHACVCCSCQCQHAVARVVADGRGWCGQDSRMIHVCCCVYLHTHMHTCIININTVGARVDSIGWCACASDGGRRDQMDKNTSFHAWKVRNIEHLCLTD